MGVFWGGQPQSRGTGSLGLWLREPFLGPAGVSVAPQSSRPEQEIFSTGVGRRCVYTGACGQGHGKRACQTPQLGKRFSVRGNQHQEPALCRASDPLCASLNPEPRAVGAAFQGLWLAGAEPLACASHSRAVQGWHRSAGRWDGCGLDTGSESLVWPRLPAMRSRNCAICLWGDLRGSRRVTAS